MALAAGRLEVTLEYGQNLKDHDWFGRQDPYCIVRCGNQTMRSKTHVDGGRNPVWNQTLTFNIINENTIDVEVWDADTVSRDDKIGSCSISLHQARQNGKDRQQVALVSPKSHKQRGIISVSFVFHPNNPAPSFHAASMPYPAPYGYAPSFHAPSFHQPPYPAPYPPPQPAYPYAAPPPAYAAPPAPAYYPPPAAPPPYGAPPAYATAPPAYATAPPAYATAPPAPVFNYYPQPPRY